MTGAVCLALVALVFVAFGRALAYGFVDFDDNVYVYANPNITAGLTLHGIGWAFTHLHAQLWQPLTTISHMLDCTFYGLNAAGHHLSNLLLHATAAVLLFVALRQLTIREGVRSIWPSAIVAAVFAVHPLRVESVVWVAERKDVLSGVFFMLTLWAYARYTQSEERRARFYVVALLLFALGLMAKASLVTVPFLLLLLDYWPLRRVDNGTGWLRLAGEKLPFLLLSIAASVVAVIAQKGAMPAELTLPVRIDIHRRELPSAGVRFPVR